MIKKKYLKSKDRCKVTFTLSPETVQNADKVRVLGDFNDWSWEDGLQMKAVKTGLQASIELQPGKNYEFRYLTDNGQWINDGTADEYTPAPFEGVQNCVISLPAQLDSNNEN